VSALCPTTVACRPLRRQDHSDATGRNRKILLEMSLGSRRTLADDAPLREALARPLATSCG
jgi:hypothetical protein